VTALVAWSPFIPNSLAFHAVVLAVIAAIYGGFAFADGRLSIAILELSVGTTFVVLARILGRLNADSRCWVIPTKTEEVGELAKEPVDLLNLARCDDHVPPRPVRAK
jgi:hypothetical protein